MSDNAFLEKLFGEIESRRGASPETSYSAQLLADLPRAARKVGEEGVEAAIAALSGDDAELVGEAADIIYHLMVLLAARGLTLGQVVEELQRREGVSGLAEKAARGKQSEKGPEEGDGA